MGLNRRRLHADRNPNYRESLITLAFSDQTHTGFMKSAQTIALGQRRKNPKNLIVMLHSGNAHGLATGRHATWKVV